MRFLRSYSGARGTILWAVLALVLLAAGWVGYLHVRYPGFCAVTRYQILDGGLKESGNLYLALTYWARFLDQLEVDKETGMVGFPDWMEADFDRFEAGQRAYFKGDFDRAVSLLEESVEKEGESEEGLFWLAMAYVRRAERDNCLAILRSESADREGLCTLPLERHYTQSEDSRKAADLFVRLLNRYGENTLYQWLLNYSYMTIGGYPSDVPREYLIEGSFTDHMYGEARQRIRTQYQQLSFSEKAHELGIDTFDAGKGVAVEDFNQDGFLDIITGGSSKGEGVHYYVNEEGSSFRDETDKSGLADVKQPHMITAADYDNDGRIDLFVGSLFHTYRLFRNLGDGVFVDVTSSSGLLAATGQKRTMTWASAWSDIDNDGDLDLFVAEWGIKIPFVTGFLSEPRMDSTLFINDGGHFTDRTVEYGLKELVQDKAFIGAGFGDFDNDGFADLFLSSISKRSSCLLRNVSGHSFELVEKYSGGFVCSFLDIDHDGTLEIFHGGLGDARTTTAKTVFGETFGFPRTARSSILKQDSSGHYVEVPGYFKGNMPISIMGASYGDLNNDGCVDFYFGTGGPESWFILNNLMYVGERKGNDCLAQAENISMLENFGTVQKGHGIVFADFDEDGDQDLYSSLGGMWPGDRWTNQFFVNNSQLNHSWVKIRLRGRQTNRSGIGCRIKVTALDDQGQEIVRHYHMDGKLAFGSPPFLAHVGLLNAVSIQSVEVYWPVSEMRKSYEAAINSLVVLDESQGS